MERQYGSFTRSFTLPNSVDPEKVSAHYDKGVLKIKLAKQAEADQGKRRQPEDPRRQRAQGRRQGRARTVVSERELMKNTKFIVKVDRGGTHAAEYVQRIDRTPVQMTFNRKLALLIGRFTADDAVKSIQNSRRFPELVSVEVSA